MSGDVSDGGPIYDPAPDEAFHGKASTLSFGYDDNDGHWVKDGRTYVGVRLDTNPRLGFSEYTLFTPEALAAHDANLRAEIAAEIRALQTDMRDGNGWDEDWSTREVRDALAKAATIAEGRKP